MCNQKISPKIVTNDKIINTNKNDVETILIEPFKELYINIHSPTQEMDRLKKHARGFVLKKKPYMTKWY